ncbi:MAG: sodium:proline symporter [candidate division KSB1 bacterium]|nr:sodium:proline symporter [candidate division KSB1 bacterium]MDZ7303444.1 sodium:proline symporter [candidate division KSB1 bacterium]MDZ7312526.1 sodium:proline symporter [candidate division KSB1 bacterium]
MSLPKIKMRQVVDWRAAVLAGIFSGIIFLAVNMLLTNLYVGSPWVVVRLTASLVMGTDVLPPPATFDVTIFIVALVVHFVLSIIFASLIAIVFHRWGLLIGILGGAAFGLVLYAINFYTITFFFPWFFPMRSWIVAVSHLVFGACAGGFYEAMEVERFVPVKA